MIRKKYCTTNLKKIYGIIQKTKENIKQIKKVTFSSHRLVVITEAEKLCCILFRIRRKVVWQQLTNQYKILYLCPVTKIKQLVLTLCVNCDNVHYWLYYTFWKQYRYTIGHECMSHERNLKIIFFKKTRHQTLSTVVMICTKSGCIFISAITVKKGRFFVNFKLL